MSTVSVPGPLQDLIDRGLVDLADVQAAFDSRSVSTPVYSALGPEVRDQLLAGSGLDSLAAERVRADWANPERAAARRWAVQSVEDAFLVASSATVDQLAVELAVDPATVIGWHDEGSIVGFIDARGRLRLPRWQFTPGGPLRGWAKIARRATELPVTILTALMNTGQAELAGRTPLEWLAGGGDPTPVAELVAGLTEW